MSKERVIKIPDEERKYLSRIVRIQVEAVGGEKTENAYFVPLIPGYNYKWYINKDGPRVLFDSFEAAKKEFQSKSIKTVTEPKPYFMTNPEDLKRWFREMQGYLKTQNFGKEGTDREGRNYAWEALHQLEELLTYHTEDIKLVCKGCNDTVKITNLKEIDPRVFLCQYCRDKVNENM